MDATPIFRLTGTGGTVKLEWANAPEIFNRLSREVPVQIRQKLASLDDAGFVNVIKGEYTLNGQTQKTNHKYVTPDQDALLLTWNESKDLLSFYDGTSTVSVIILRYKAEPKTVLFRHHLRVVVEELTLMAFEDD